LPIPDLIREHGAGGQHLHAGTHDAGVSLGNDLQARIVALLPRKQLTAAQASRRHDRKAEIKIVAPRALVVANEVLSEAACRFSSTDGFIARPVIRPATCSGERPIRP
jgi:hypothetical protein